jgi:hypothetical protein
MTSRIFLSHAGPDTETAKRVAETLGENGLETMLDRDELGQGDSFLSFMEEALSTSDYCLLLWSEVASERKWVQVEWEAALYRSIKEARAFLAIGRLDEHPLPALLSPRLYVQLYPDIEPGISTLLESWRDDRDAEAESDRIVGSAPNVDETPGDEKQEGEMIYVTSDLFGITCPWKADLAAPAGVLLDEVRKKTDLPESLDHDGRVGLRFEYHLGFDEARLERGRTLADQGVGPKSVVWIESEIKMFTPEGEQATTLHRGVEDIDVMDRGRELLLSRIDSAGLGIRGPREGKEKP